MTATETQHGRPIRVATAGGVYGVHIGRGLLDNLGELLAEVAPAARRVQIVHDRGLPDATVEKAAASIRARGLGLGQTAVESGESNKTLQTVESILRELAAARHERKDVVLALGGGMVGDVAGFAAASYRRGCPVVQCPTTLLSMVDASVGGKTGVNLAAGSGQVLKNFVGAFYQPLMVVADTDTLLTLDKRTLHAGFAECVKHGLIAASRSVGAPDPELFAWTEEHAEALRDPSSPEMRELIARNVSVKAAVVGADEREIAPSEEGGRALLNLGHTFAHVIEPMPGLSPDGDASTAPLQHGEAVSVGAIAACAAAVDLGLASEAVLDRAKGLFSALGLPVSLSGLPQAGELIAPMRDDKKVDAGKLRLILPTGMGSCRVVEEPATSAIEAGWAAVRA